MNIVAFSNNDVATVAWTFDRKIDECLGFAVYRIDVNAGTEVCLPALATFPKQTPAPGRTTADDPVQKFYWKDVYAKRGGLYKYKVVPMSGSPGDLEAMPLGPLISNAVVLTPQRGLFSAYFNRGILATQATAHAISKDGAPSLAVLLDNIKVPGNQLRERLAGDMITALLTLLRRAETEGGDVYCALYELEDVELVGELQKLSGRLHIVLSNLQGKDDPDVDKPQREALESSGADKFDRIFKSGQIGHNKFVVYVKDKPQAVLLGSTNWTYHALCAQTNNSLIVESPALADAYFEYWKQLQADTENAAGNPKLLQSPELRSTDQKAQDIAIEDGSATVDLWFSPNTDKLRSSKPPKNEPTPVDMAEVFSLIAGAQQAVLFLAFQPGNPSIIDAVAKAQLANPSLFIRGALTNADSAGQFYTELHGMQKQKHQKGDPPAKQDPRVISAKGIKDAFGVWEKELNQAGHAVIHDKIVVIDPFSRDCTVITGSHNLGYRASGNNDENMAIVRGHRPLAEAYMTHVLDVYDHYAWRYMLQENGKTAFRSLDPTPAWQDKYFDQNGALISAQLRFWLSGVPSANALPVTDSSLSSTRVPIPITSQAVENKPSKGETGRRPRVRKRGGR